MIQVNATIRGNCNTGQLVAALATDCHGTPLTSADVRSILYNIFEEYPEGSGQLTPNPDHKNIDVPVASILDTPAVYTCEETGVSTTYNFLYQVSAATSLPFPVRNATYILEFIFRTADKNEPQALTIRVTT